MITYEMSRIVRAPTSHLESTQVRSFRPYTLTTSIRHLGGSDEELLLMVVLGLGPDSRPILYQKYLKITSIITLGILCDLQMNSEILMSRRV